MAEHLPTCREIINKEIHDEDGACEIARILLVKYVVCALIYLPCIDFKIMCDGQKINCRFA